MAPKGAGDAPCRPRARTHTPFLPARPHDPGSATRDLRFAVCADLGHCHVWCAYRHQKHGLTRVNELGRARHRLESIHPSTPQTKPRLADQACKLPHQLTGAARRGLLSQESTAVAGEPIERSRARCYAPHAPHKQQQCCVLGVVWRDDRSCAVETARGGSRCYLSRLAANTKHETTSSLA